MGLDILNVTKLPADFGLRLVHWQLALPDGATCAAVFYSALVIKHSYWGGRDDSIQS
tara:strand:- start:213 stop:383 length:171 start_codon:yes stop_codon:yes gene_type:complete